ncbi:hypothetical protein POTOM_050064 [Populus tomentosa]|uniref:Uncharacterized protein n=1 Tax=Populus tomentosa TaxID=118781 RepID=A0A8X8C942_POPTO|nr:hypothetical protein POTOM_050064 [Populus tomentosa]
MGIKCQFSGRKAGICGGLRITEERILLDSSPENPLEFIQVQIAYVKSKFAIVISDSSEIKVEGRVKDRKPHLTKVDQPDMIGSVENILGEENVNVSFMSIDHQVILVGHPSVPVVKLSGLCRCPLCLRRRAAQDSQSSGFGRQSSIKEITLDDDDDRGQD